MATITFLNPSGANLSTTVLSNSARTNISVVSNNAPWIYCNYPEQIGGGDSGYALAENGYFINQQTIIGSAGIFFSHWNRTGKTLKYRIHLYNMSASTATVVRSKCGFSSGWTTPATAVTQFFASSSQT